MQHFTQTSSAAETQSLAARVAAALPKPCLVLLKGPLGAGKTTFVQGMAQGLGVKEAVTSPSFLLMKEYKGERILRHIDLFRLQRQEEILGLGLIEDLPEDAVIAVEWADRFPIELELPTLEVRMVVGGEPKERRLVFSAYGFNPEEQERIEDALRAG